MLCRRRETRQVSSNPIELDQYISNLRNANLEGFRPPIVDVQGSIVSRQ